MATNINKYRVYCSTDSQYEYVWGEAEPTTCPTNTAHTIDFAKTAIIQVRDDNEVKIQEEETKTGGHYQSHGIHDAIPATIGWHDMPDLSFPFPVGVLAAEAMVKAENGGDELEALIAPDTTIGAIAANVAASATVIDVDSSVMANIFVGQYVKLDDGTNVDDCGRVLSVDTVNDQITVETATTNSFLAATPTYMKVTTKMVVDLELAEGMRIVAGESKIGASHLPANKPIRVRYNNKDGVAKRFSIMIEYLY